MIEAIADEPFETIISGFPAGHPGDWSIEVYEPEDGSTVLAASAAGITEPRPGTYRAERTLATAGSFMVRWLNGAGLDPVEEVVAVAAAAASPPPQPAPEPPYDAAAIRARSPLLRQRYPEGGEHEADLLAVIEDASAVVGALTGRLIPPLTVGEPIPAGLLGVAVRAVARMAELMDTESSAEFADTASRGRRLRGFTAGPYSEQYFSPGDLVIAKGARPQFSPDPTLDRLLWALATQDAIDELMAMTTGIQPPAGIASAFDYRQMGGYGARVGLGPDGF